MPDESKKLKIVKKKVEDYVQTKPSQLELFEYDYVDTKSDIYSNTIELYDQMPKYFFGGAEREIGKTVDALPILSRNFKHRSKEFNLNISPAALIDRKNGKTVHHYPSQREELVEDALRKLAVNKKGIFLDNDAAVKFTLYELQQELQKSGHGYNLNQIKEAIEVCNKSVVEIIDKEGDDVSITSTIFPFVGMENSSGAGEGVKGKDRVVVMFHPLVTKSINQRTYRLYNYNKVMTYKMAISRWLHKRISHNFTQASATNPYGIYLSTIVRDSGMKVYERKSDSLKQVIKSLEEMVSIGTLSKYKVSKNMVGRKLKDASLELYVSDEFVSDVKKANKFINMQIEFSGTKEFAEKIEEIRTELLKPIYGLTQVVINNIIANIKDADDQISVLNSLSAAREFFDTNPTCNHPAVTKTSLKEGWKPRKKKALPSILEQAIEIEERTERERKEEKENLEKQKRRMELDSNPVWTKIHSTIKSEFGDEEWKKLFSQLALGDIRDSVVTILAPSKFIRDWIIKEYVEKDEKGKKSKSLLTVIKKILPSIEKVRVVAE